MDLNLIETGEQVILGRQDYGWGVTAEVVTVNGEPFARRNGRFYTPCGYCHDVWSGSKPAFAHRHAGVCYQCNGRGWHKMYESAEKIVKIAKRREADRARRDRKAAEKAAAEKAAVVAWRGANPEVAAAADEVMADAPMMADGLPDYAGNDAWIERWSDFVTSLANQAQFRPLSEKQTEAFLPAFEQAKAAYAAAQATAAKQHYLDTALGAKVTVTGVVAVSMNIEVNDRYSYSGTSHKRLVIVEGTGDFDGVTLKMFGTSQVMYDTERGQAVEVTGTVKDFAEYDGVPQTVLIRPKFKVLAEADQ